jgi:hypothetical protein
MSGKKRKLATILKTIPADIHEKVPKLGTVFNLSDEEVKKLFDTPVQNSVKWVREAITHMKEKGKIGSHIDVMSFIGGFSGSHFLREALKKNFASEVGEFRLHDDGEHGDNYKTAVVQGACVYGLSPNIVTLRVAKTTYGVATINYPIKSDDDINNFSELIVKGEELPKDKFIDQDFYYLEQSNKVNVRLFCSDEDEIPKKTTDRTAKYLQQLCLQTELFDKETKEVIVRLDFTGTENRWTVLDKQKMPIEWRPLG